MFNPAKHTFTVLLSLGLVLCLIYGLAFLAKKFKANKFITKNLDIESVIHLNSKVKLMIVNVADQRILLGVASDSVNKLCDLESFKKLTCSKDGCE